MVCKSWHCPARYHLYATIALSDAPGTELCVLKLKCAMSSPTLSVLVRELDIEAMYTRGQNGLCLSLLPSLRKLLVHSVLPEDVEMFAGTTLPRLRSLEHLEIDGTAFLPNRDFVRLWNAVADVQSLKHLALSVLVTKPLSLADALATATPRTSRPALLSLDLRDPTGICTFPVDALDVALSLFDLSELRSLTLNNATQSLAIASQARDTLQELVVVQRGTVYEPPDIPTKIHMDILFRIQYPALESITLTCSQHVRDSIRISLRPANLPQWKALDGRLLELARSTALQEVNVVELVSDNHMPVVPWEPANPPTCERFRQMLPQAFRLGLVRTEVHLTRKEAEAERRLRRE
ncbi:hypothetical protein V5O48_007049 [Marasmius crinis-equi]|uniref:Uncharacterized protein n=1 Tax=Marasmius crinis-equi TaxID=585013 RepID=A0ABR3FHT5_9AGAR